jgi:hypothetical protein
MATRLFTTLIPRLNPSVPGCSQPMMIQYIRDSAIRVCERSLAWRYTEPVFTLLPGVHEYLYSKPVQADVHVLFEALVNGRPLTRMTLEQAIGAYPEWADLYSGEDPSVLWSLTPPGSYNTFEYNTNLFNDNEPFVLPESVVAAGSEPRTITQITPERYIVLPLPDADKPYEMRMFYALKPSRTADGMDERVFNELEDAILHGALQHLLVLPNVGWKDRELATYHAKQFLREVTSRRAQANLGNMRGTMYATAPKFA